MDCITRAEIATQGTPPCFIEFEVGEVTLYLSTALSIFDALKAEYDAKLSDHIIALQLVQSRVEWTDWMQVIDFVDDSGKRLSQNLCSRTYRREIWLKPEPC